MLLASASTGAIAQDGPAPEGDGAPTANVVDGTSEGRGTVYEPAYFAQFAPRNALDMVTRIPGFVITGSNGSARGLGQASENVLINGERLASKSDGVRDQLQRIPASDVVRIEIVDGTVLDIPGLTGQVANVVIERAGSSGQFRYTAGFRAYNAKAQLYGGEISLTGSSGALDYTVALSNGNQRFGADGDIVITDGRGNLIETQDTSFSGGFDNPQLSTRFAYKFSDKVLANLNLKYGEDFFFEASPELAIPVLGPRRSRLADIRERGPEYEIGGDIEFPLGPGTMKLIGLERFERDEFRNSVVDSFDDGTLPRG
ncbi:MAG: TonB-dependent receptor plug domain-containing protein, partial [Erythrobacter sp.]|nr:TonB-dependent receptor plug domain-containing protein [Erythrobacter sp.]